MEPRTRRRQVCGAALESDIGGRFACTLKRGHTGDHCDRSYPYSWPQGVTRMTQGQLVVPRRPVDASKLVAWLIAQRDIQYGAAQATDVSTKTGKATRTIHNHRAAVFVEVLDNLNAITSRRRSK